MGAVKMVNTGVYVRVSTDEQAREGFSIRAQEEKLRAYATLKEWNIFSVYADEGISGKDIEGRPAIKQMLADVTSGKVKNVLVYKIDRLTRSTKNLIELVEMFNTHNCAFNSLSESIDTSSATGRMFLKIVGIFAEFERENLSERTRLGFERKAKEGYSLCSHISSFGYNRENGNRIQEINEEEAATVRRIFKMYLHDDFTFSQIADTLNNENVTTKLNKAWITRGVRNVLSNPNYVGKVRYSMEDETRYFEVDGHHAPIVDETTYYQVQEKIGKIQKITKTKRPTEEVYFCGVLSCKLCDGKYTTHWQHRKDTASGKTITHVSYRCVNKNSTLQKCCNAKIIAHSKVEKAFENYLANYEDCQTQTEKPQHDNSAEIATMTAEVKQIEKKTAEIINLFVASAIDFNTYQGMVKASNERRGELESRLILLQNAQKEKAITYSAKDIITNFRKNWGKLKNVERLQFMQKFIKKVIIYSNPEKYHGEIVIDEIVFNEF